MAAAKTALVVGGGVAGPVVAMALQRAGIDAAVVEARSGPADDVGTFLTLQINGLDALRAVGLDGVVAGLGFPTSAMRIRSGTGRLLGEIGTGAPPPGAPVAVTLRRSVLYRALREEALRRGIRADHGRRLVAATSAGAGVRATFADGGHAEADVLVGADGLRSTVRTIIGPSAPAPRYLPVLNLGGYAPPQETGAAPGQYEMIFGKRAFFGYAVDPGGEIWWFANPPSRTEPARGELAAITTEQWRARLVELFAEDRTPAAAIIRSTPGELVGLPIHDLPTVPRWHRDRMVIIGDAAHATAPSSGQGASMAIEDAVQLARCLRDLPDPAAAFSAFEGMRRRRVEKIVAGGARTSSSKAAGPVGRVLRDATMPLFLPLAGRSQAWIHRHHIDWAAPVAAQQVAAGVG